MMGAPSPNPLGLQFLFSRYIPPSNEGSGSTSVSVVAGRENISN